MDRRKYRKKKFIPKDVDLQGKRFVNGNEVFDVAKENDPIWWCKDVQLVKDAANLPYSWATGPNYATQTGNDVPSVMTLEFVPCPGISRDATSPINIAARRHYAYIRSANSGAKNYGPQDLIQYFMAMDSVYLSIAYLMRVYGLVNLYAAENRFVPKFLMNALRINYEDIASHIPDLRAFINLMIYKAASFAVPNEMGLFERHIQLCSNVYSDYNNTRAQMYIYRPDGAYVWDETNGVLNYTATPGTVATNATFADLKTWAEAIIMPVASSETASIMSGDILKACGDKIIKLSPMREDYLTLPVYSTEVLTQIHNSVVLGPLYSDYNITQNAAQDTLIYDPVITATSIAPTACINKLQMDRIIDVPFDEITPALNMVATRDVYFAVPISGDTAHYKLDSAGTEILTEANMWTIEYSAGLGRDVARNNTIRTCLGMAYTILGAISAMTTIGQWSKFDWAFETCLCYKDNNNVEKYTTGIRDVTKYTVVNAQTIARLHEVALLSAFTSPAVAQRLTVK